MWGTKKKDLPRRNREGIDELLEYLSDDLEHMTLEQAQFKQSIGLNEWDPLPEGVEYVHENTKENEFIRELVNLVAKHGCTIDQIYELFTARSDRVGREKMDNGEFDERIWFEDDADDPYYYCFKQEGGHMIYHRFLPEDYEDFEF